MITQTAYHKIISLCPEIRSFQPSGENDALYIADSKQYTVMSYTVHLIVSYVLITAGKA